MFGSRFFPVGFELSLDIEVEDRPHRCTLQWRVAAFQIPGVVKLLDQLRVAVLMRGFTDRLGAVLVGERFPPSDVFLERLVILRRREVEEPVLVFDHVRAHSHIRMNPAQQSHLICPNRTSPIRVGDIRQIRADVCRLRATGCFGPGQFAVVTHHGFR